MLTFGDVVYDDAGWLPLDDMAGTVELRREVGSGQTRVDLASDVRPFLIGLVGVAPSV